MEEDDNDLTSLNWLHSVSILPQETDSGQVLEDISPISDQEVTENLPRRSKKKSDKKFQIKRNPKNSRPVEPPPLLPEAALSTDESEDIDPNKKVLVHQVWPLTKFLSLNFLVMQNWFTWNAIAINVFS